MAGVSPQHRLQPSWDPGLTIAHLSLPHLLSQGLAAAVLDVDRTLLPGRDVTLPDPVLAWLTDAKRRRTCSATTHPGCGLQRWLTKSV